MTANKDMVLARELTEKLLGDKFPDIPLRQIPTGKQAQLYLKSLTLVRESYNFKEANNG